jgi:hypothetical protein
MLGAAGGGSVLAPSSTGMMLWWWWCQWSTCSRCGYGCGERSVVSLNNWQTKTAARARQRQRTTRNRQLCPGYFFSADETSSRMLAGWLGRGWVVWWLMSEEESPRLSAKHPDPRTAGGCRRPRDAASLRPPLSRCLGRQTEHANAKCLFCSVGPYPDLSSLLTITVYFPPHPLSEFFQVSQLSVLTLLI